MKVRRRESGKKKEASRSVHVGAGKSGKPRTVKFETNAEHGSEVYLTGSFNNWDSTSIGMKHNGDGCYEAAIKLPPGRHEYKFVVNGVWQADQRCQQWVPNAVGSINSVVEVF